MAGLNAACLQRQRDDFANGTRANAVMKPGATALSEAERKAFAGYYSKMPIPPALAKPPTASATAGTTPDGCRPDSGGFCSCGRNDGRVTHKNKFFSPPPDSAIPQGPFGDMVRPGRAIFAHISENAKPHVGNRLNCSNCPLDAGRQANSAPLWGRTSPVRNTAARTGTSTMLRNACRAVSRSA